MVSRENLPKIVADIQDVVKQLHDEFINSKQPITDDSQALHRLCAKLEFLLTSSLKEKGVFGGKKSYWQWMYSCLHRTKGLQDGLKFVQANKEIRTSCGKGRALIRYCLVHQTLADSLQNCVMSENVQKHYLNEHSVLRNHIHASTFITSLYDLNAVNFDLNAKGYDLDSGWPTFASKSFTPGSDQWALQSHVGSLGSLTSASIIMDNPHIHGSGSSTQLNVDQRIEDLVLELDQSDAKIQEQQAFIAQLEGKAESLEKSTNEKEDILARVISDLEAKNRHLHEAMSNMTSEFQAREQNWREKTENLNKIKLEMNSKIKELVVKVAQIEEDKRNLEELVSQNLSTITQNFAEEKYSKEPTPMWLTLDNKNDRTLQQLNEENVQLRKDFDRSQQTCAKLEEKLNKKSYKEAQFVELQAALEDQEERTIGLMEKLKTEIKESTERELLTKICTEAKIDTSLSIPMQVSNIIEKISLISETVVEETVQSSSHYNDNPSKMISSLKDEKNCLLFDRDSAITEAGEVWKKWNATQLELDDAKVQLESSRSESGRRIIELEEEVSVKQAQILTLQHQHAEMLGDLKVAQESLDDVTSNLEASRQAYKHLEIQFKNKESEWSKSLDEFKTQTYNDISEKESMLTEFKDEAGRLSTHNNIVGQLLEKEKVKSSKLESDIQIANENLGTLTEKLYKSEKLLLLTNERMEQRENQNNETVATINEEKSKHAKHVEKLSGSLRACLNMLGNREDDLQNREQEEIMETSLEKCKFLCEKLLSHSKNITAKLSDKENEIVSMKLQFEIFTTTAQNELKDEKTQTQMLRGELEKLKLKLDVFQEEKFHNLSLIEKLQQETVDLRVTLNGSRCEVDEARLKVMEGSTREVDLQDIIANYEIDIEHLKEKITQLLLDKDTLWKEGENLKTRTSELEESLDEVNWVHDSDATKCSSCKQQFSLTIRKHHCRMCGKIFCKTCSENWILKKNKKIRVCCDCVSNSCNVSMEAHPASTTVMTEDSSVSFEEISSGVCDESTATDSSLYQSFTDFISKATGSQAESQYEEGGSVTVHIAARKENHIPVLLEKEGIALRWNITSDRDINFRIFYSLDQESEEQELVPSTRITSHIEPFIGQVVAQRPGVYTIVLDNSYSRMTAKEVTYKLDIVSP